MLTARYQVTREEKVFTVLKKIVLIPLTHICGTSPMAQEVKNLAAVQEIREIWIRSWVRKIPLEKGMTTHSSTLACKIPWPGGLQSIGSQRVVNNRGTEHIYVTRICIPNKQRMLFGMF